MVRDIILATTSEIEGRPVQEYFGIVTGEATMPQLPSQPPSEGGNRRKDQRAAKLEHQVRETRDRALDALVARATELGATAVIAIVIDYTSVSTVAGGDFLVIAASGTAVLL